MGAYADKVTRNRGTLTSAQIRKNKCERSKTRGEALRLKRREEAETRNEYWQSLSTKDKISSLKRRRGESKKQLAKLSD